MKAEGIRFARTFDGHGGGARIDLENISEELSNAGLAWVHINGIEARDWIRSQVAYLDDIILDALLAEQTHPRVLDHGDGLLMILRGVNLDPDQRPEDMVSLRLWIDDQRIISVERAPVRTMAEIDESLDRGRGPKNAGEFLTMIVAHLFDHIDDAMARLHERLDALEDMLETSPEKVAQKELTQLRRMAISFHRYVAPQRDVINTLRRTEKSWLRNTQRRTFTEEWDRINRMVENLDFLRDRARIVYEELSSLTSQRTNRNLYLLSGIATIFMPLSFVAGLMGMNVGGIPGADNPDGFAIVTAMTMFCGCALAAVFKWLKWF